MSVDSTLYVLVEYGGRTLTPAVRVQFAVVREREIVPTPYLLILGGMSSGLGGMASTRGGLISVWPCASEESESTLREADVLATLPMYDPGMLASWYRR